MNNVRFAVGALVYVKDKILLVRKVMMMDGKAGSENIDPFWDFPKGGVKESDKDYENAVIRELAEEIGSDKLTVIKQLPDFTFDFSAYVAKKIGFNSQVTKMFLIRFDGMESDLSPQDKEIDQISFFSKEEVEKKISFENSRKYVSDNFKMEDELIQS